MSDFIPHLDAYIRVIGALFAIAAVGSVLLLLWPYEEGDDDE